MLKNIKLIIAYDGTNFQGWQRGSEGKSFEEVLQKVLEKICQHPIHLQAASRTDAGVHAAGQVVNFLTSKELNVSQCLFSLNQLLPKEIRILEIADAKATFHPSLDVVTKEYRYYICNSPVQLPQNRNYSWHVYQKLNFQAMTDGMNYLVGEHDFSSFCNHHVGNNYSDNIRNVFSFQLFPISEDRFYFSICGNHFLYKMVRNMVGTVINIGQGKIKPEELPKILLQKDRKSAGISAPSHGLFLHEIRY